MNLKIGEYIYFYWMSINLNVYDVSACFVGSLIYFTEFGLYKHGF